ncbi:alternative ribosome rescue aminoacyl-tRNA hydrolase ArfB [Carboxylicivirga linearis]|uniref:Aminoacyl-tRNA hydrolase n=1 Tax=Carboxylicivirga linearis TaxID=1628157 RepID=A0ABS5JX40_9BACT|nr:alternative ribosome rescue aminoacyl-tRNA hydrolase ArfB [Carboxylicivirga linearis]MBS2099453.1 aminoacyl-tRNA hydrolase [Carboxylicivirga linearis]
MTEQQLKNRDFSSELKFSASRSGGPGGQNVNKVNSKVELRFHIESSQLLTDHEKSILIHKLANKLSQEGELILTAQTERSQLKNKLIVTERFYNILASALTPQKKRKPTRRTKSSIEKRLNSKRKQAEKKANRRFTS